VEHSKKPFILIVAWVAILASSLPHIILQELFHYKLPEELQVGIPGLIALAGFGLTFLWQAIRPLRSFFGLLVVLVAAQWLVYTQVDRLPFYQSWLHNPSFNVYMLAEQSLRLMVTLAVIAVLFAVKKKASAFFLIKGDTAAPVEPVNWLGAKPGERWNTFGATSPSSSAWGLWPSWSLPDARRSILSFGRFPSSRPSCWPPR